MYTYILTPQHFAEFTKANTGTKERCGLRDEAARMFDIDKARV